MPSRLSSSTAYPMIARIAARLTSLTRIAFAGTLLTGTLFAGNAAAQESQVIRQGSMSVTGFSKTVIPGIEEGLPPGVDAIDETMIDLEGKTLRVFDVSNLGGPASGQLVNTPLPFEVPARQIGQVFGLAYDDGVRTDTTDICSQPLCGGDIAARHPDRHAR